VVDGLEGSASTVVVALVDVGALEEQAVVTEVKSGQAMLGEDGELGGDVGRWSDLLVHLFQFLDHTTVNDGVELTRVQVDGLSVEGIQRVDLVLVGEALSGRDEAADVDLFGDEQAGGFCVSEGTLSAIVGSLMKLTSVLDTSLRERDRARETIAFVGLPPAKTPMPIRDEE